MNLDKVAIIPARGGSKRIPRKNIREFCGKPMIAWPIAAAASSGCFDRIIVSTEDPEIAQVAQDVGAEIPFLRPAELADDYTGTVAVMRHAVEWLQENETAPGLACCVYATAPFVSPADLARGQLALEEADASYALSVTTFPFPIQRAVRITEQNRLAMFYPEYADTRSQDLEEAYHDAAQFYWGQRDAWLTGKPLFGEETVPVVLPRIRVQDIDTEEDWQRAELMFRAGMIEHSL